MSIAPSAGSWHDQASNSSLEGRLFIDGKFRAAASGKMFESINIANGLVLAEVSRGGNSQ